MTQQDKVNAWFRNDGSYLPDIPGDATPTEVRAICQKLDATVGEAQRRHMMGEIACRALFAANLDIAPADWGWSSEGEMT
jgi:hypothetical protein